MQEETHDIYQAPESNIQVEASTHDSLALFKRFSAWGVFGLSIITLGIYSIYWLYSRSKIMNEVHKDVISNNLLIIFVLSYVVYTVVDIVSYFYDPIVLTYLSAAILLCHSVSYLMVLFKLRARLQTISSKPINGVLTFFFHEIYLQYKINQCKDEF